MNQWNPLKEVREWHPAVSNEQCEVIEERLKKMGLRIELTAVYKTKDQTLRAACIFEGPDADPKAERWKSYYEVD